MNKRDKEAVEKALYGVIGAIVDVEELRLKSASQDDCYEIHNFILSTQNSIADLAKTFKIEL